MKETKKGKEEKKKESKEKKERGERTSMFQEARFSVATAFVGRTDAGAQSIVSVFGQWDARCWVSLERWFGLRLLTYSTCHNKRRGVEEVLDGLQKTPLRKRDS